MGSNPTLSAIFQYFSLIRIYVRIIPAVAVPSVTMKKFLGIVFLGLFLITPSQADDIRDFEIEGMSIGDKLLNYSNFNKVDEGEFIKVALAKDNDYSLSVFYQKNDSEKIIQGIEAIYYQNLSSCLESKKKASEDELIINSEVINMGKIVLDSIKINKSFYIMTNGFLDLTCYQDGNKREEFKISIQNDIFRYWAMERISKSKHFFIKKIYKLDNGKTIIIQSHGRGNTIWQVNEATGELKLVTKLIWNFIDLAKSCEMIKEKDIYFATNLEYWFAGGTNIDYPTIRIFKLYDPSPYHDSYLGVSPDMKYAKQFCNFYKPIYSYK